MRLDICAFCDVSSTRLWLERETAIVFADPNPLADGHMVVVPRQHVGTIYELSGVNQMQLWELVSEVRSRLPLQTASASVLAILCMTEPAQTMPPFTLFPVGGATISICGPASNG